MKRLIHAVILVLALLTITTTAGATYPDWPDTTLTTWEEKSDVICYEELNGRCAF